MDLLSQRYANPCFFMDGMIQTCRFSSFVTNLVSTTNKEKEEKTQWEFFLHKVFEGSFADFIEGIKQEEELRNMSESDIETTIKHSINIMNNFKPDE